MNNKEKALTELKRLGWSVVDESASERVIILEKKQRYANFTVEILYQSKEVCFMPYHTYDYIDFESLKYINQLIQEVEHGT